MPSDLTIFAAKYLVFIEAALAVILLGFVLYRRPYPAIVRWSVATVIMLILAYAFAKIGAHLYNDPRPFSQDHVKPLISHAADNGFPSDHALLAAAIVAAVLLISPPWAIPFAVLAFLVDWARVGAGIHHVADVIGSSVFVAIAALIGWALAPVITDWLIPRLPLPQSSQPAPGSQ